MSDEHAWVFYSKEKKKLKSFDVGENKYPRMLIVQVWNIFSGFFLSDKKTHACLKTYVEIFDQFCKIGESPHKSYEHTWFFSNSQIGLNSSYEEYLTHYPKKTVYCKNSHT